MKFIVLAVLATAGLAAAFPPRESVENQDWTPVTTHNVGAVSSGTEKEHSLRVVFPPKESVDSQDRAPFITHNLRVAPTGSVQQGEDDAEGDKLVTIQTSMPFRLAHPTSFLPVEGEDGEQEEGDKLVTIQTSMPFRLPQATSLLPVESDGEALSGRVAVPTSSASDSAMTFSIQTDTVLESSTAVANEGMTMTGVPALPTGNAKSGNYPEDEITYSIQTDTVLESTATVEARQLTFDKGMLFSEVNDGLPTYTAATTTVDIVPATRVGTRTANLS